MKNKEPSKLRSAKKEKLKKQENSPDNKIGKNFNMENLCKSSDSDDSIQDTITQTSNNYRGKRKNTYENLTNLSPIKTRKKSFNSPMKNFHIEHCNIHSLLRENFSKEILKNDPFKQSKNNKIKDIYNYQEFDHYPYDHSLIKNLDFDVELDLKKISLFKDYKILPGKNKTLKNDICQEVSALKNYILNYFQKNILFYYEFKNSNSNESKINHFESSFSNSEKIEFNIATSKEDIYLESINYIFNKLLESTDSIDQEEEYFNNQTNNLFDFISSSSDNKFFYICLPLYACYFFNNLSSSSWRNKKDFVIENGILISNLSRNLEKKLREGDIEYEKIYNEQSAITTRRNTEKINQNGISNIYNEYNAYVQGDGYESNDSCILYIKNYNQILFFNEFINSYQESYFKILSPIPFSNSICKMNNFIIEIINNGDNYIAHISIIGCIFQTSLEKILGFFEGISNKFSFNAYHFYKTPAFYLVNDKLKNYVDFCKYENKKYFIRLKK